VPRSDDFQGHPFLVGLVSRKPDSGETACAELVHNPIAAAVEPVPQVNRMETTSFVFLNIFRADVDVLGKKKVKIIVLFKVLGRFVIIVLRRRHIGRPLIRSSDA
jgi:hypothetical protein